jgi:predicted dehydrogenase
MARCAAAGNCGRCAATTFALARKDMSEPTRVAIIGAGVFAGHHARKMAAMPDVLLVGVHDRESVRARDLAQAVGTVALAGLEDALLAAEAVVVATPASTHAAIVTKALAAGCHALVEKPLTAEASNARRLVDLAESKGLVLQAGHQERLIWRAIGLRDDLPKPSRITAVRSAPWSGRATDVSVTLDLMVHDLDLLIALLGAPQTVSAKGEVLKSQWLDEVEAQLAWEGGATATLQSSRVVAALKRSMQLEWPEGTLSIDFARKTVDDQTPWNFNAAFASVMPDPLGAADAIFIQRVRGSGEVFVPAHEAATAVALANRIDSACLA